MHSLRRHGFERVFLFTAHGGNVDALNAMRSRITESASDIVVRIETDLRVGAMQSNVVESEALPQESAGPHAGEYETSVVAMLRSGSVRREALRPGRAVASGDGQALFYPSLRPHSETGVLGDPTLASAERGKPYLDAWIDLLERAYCEAFAADAEKKRQ